MSIEVEVNLRIPRVTVSALNQDDVVIENRSVRFAKVINVPAIPKSGVSLQLTTRSGQAFDCVVARTDWNEERALFIISCHYAKRSISADEYGGLVNDADWHVRQLPE